MTDNELKRIFDQGLFKGAIKFEQPLSAYTSLKIGGPVEIMAFPEDLTSLKNVLITAGRENIPVFVLGAGTNLLVKDGGVHGIALSLKAFKNIEVIKNIKRVAPHLSYQKDADSFRGLFVEAGVPLGSVINFTKEKGYSGIEELAGIPGTFGGAVYMNAGSFHKEIKDVIISVALMKTDGSIVIVGRDELRFTYRSSNIPPHTVILSANIVLKRDISETVSLRVNEYLKKKRQTQPIGKPSAGCVFKNPEGHSAGRLIEDAGCKGMRAGDIEVNSIHANYFINKGSATCKDFIHLMDIVIKRVQEHSGITLEPEIKIVGRDD